MGIHGNTWEYVGIRVFPGLFEASGNTWQTVWECPDRHRILFYFFSLFVCFEFFSVHLSWPGQ